MTLVVNILTRAAAQCSVTLPSSWSGSTDPTILELRDFLEETAEDILDRVDCPQPLSATATITGTGVEEYDLPADFKRLHRDHYAVYEGNRTRRPCMPVSQDGAWEYLKELGSAGAYRYYRTHGYDGNFKIDFYRELGTGEAAIVNYVSKNWVVNAGDHKAEFSNDNDNCMFPRKLVEAGIVWKFRERKGLDFTAKSQEYEIQLTRYINDNRTQRVVSFGPAETLKPWDIPVPDFIPSS